ncbi:cytochrome c biogenesis protein CcsA [Blattabacterium punctulatus]|uniref:cytochrome c biogenesis protein CcsA n=1 Tax=Blattabacterium punctulatus TaxID=164514 RepID=UPI000D7BAACE|nr:cytochrome c biogenesis protein CcsA [Blattabacterium punctulatus]AWU45605.1 cytochrome C biogenesis protein [Blattabacterium punctulatus]
MRTLKNLLFSTKITSFLFLFLALSMAIATFLEKKYSTDIAKIYIYESTWFETMMILIVINLIGNIWKYKFWNKKKIPLLIFHISFVFIFIGGIISRYYSFEGMMSLREGKINGKISSRKNYIKLKIHRGINTMVYNDPYILSSFHNRYKGNFFFEGNLLKVNIIKYIPCAKIFLSKRNTKEKIIKIVSTNQQGRIENFLKNGKIIKINGFLFSLNKDIPFGIQIFEKNNKLYVKSSFFGKRINMINKKITFLSKNTITLLKVKSFYQIKNKKNIVQWVIPEGIVKGKLEYINSCNDDKKNDNLLDAITAKISFQNQYKLVTFLGGKNKMEMSEPIFFNNHQISIGYGSIFLNLPFFLRLNKFKVENYPGSEFPSFFISNITLIDKEKKKNYFIYMNHVLNYKGYRFFQSGYDPDKKGTHFSVNNDYLGTNFSYFGYFLMSIGMFLTLFWKGTRFSFLKSKLKDLSKISVFFIFFSLINSNFVFSHIHEFKKFKKISLKKISYNIHISKKHGDNFGHLLVQDNKGRIKPIHTMALDLLRKVHKKNNLGILDANQWFISIHHNNIFWTKIPFIKVDTRGGPEFLIQTKANKDGYVSMIDLYTVDSKTLKLKFNLQKDYENAFSKSPIQRNEYDKAVISLSERVGIIHGIFQGKYLRIFPIPNDINNTWSSWIIPNTNRLNPIGLLMLNNYFKSLFNAQNEQNWNISDNEIKKIQLYQFKISKSILPSKRKIDLEIFYNKLNIFYCLPFFYSVIGIIILISTFIKIFFERKYIFLIYKIFISFLFVLFIFESLGLILRWYISGHAPWSNGYESSIFISWCLVGIGLIFYKNQFVPGITALISSILLIIASHSDTMDPEITNLVPVLKSHWLIIHVAIITSSYGFFLTGSFLGFLVLILYILLKYNSNKKYKKKIKIHINKLTIINEMSLTIGLFLLTIGTFLGSIWANSSWGRYWSWDPKETWAFISIMIYAFVLHIRLIPGIKGLFFFNFSSILSVSSIIMTYFGVNYYLSGLHSYARGEPISIPYWIYYSLLILGFISLLSYYSYYSENFNEKITEKIDK